VAKQVKCPYCNQYLNKEDAYEYKKRYYHQSCFDTWQLESEHRKELLAYICEIYKLEAPTGMMLKQIKDFKDELHYKYKGMELALRYFYETLGNSVQSGTGIGIVPFVYEDAKRHYIMKLNVEKSVEENGDKQCNGRTVVVKSPEFTYQSKVKQIDISSL
jgi:hypothetical protein